MINEHGHENFLHFLASEENKKKAGGSGAEVASLRAGQAGGKEFKGWSHKGGGKRQQHHGESPWAAGRSQGARKPRGGGSRNN